MQPVHGTTREHRGPRKPVQASLTTAETDRQAIGLKETGKVADWALEK